MKRSRFHMRARPCRPAVLLILIGMVIGWQGAASAQMEADLRAVLQTVDPQEKIPVIITFAAGAPAVLTPQGARGRTRSAMIRALRTHAAGSQADTRALLRSQGATGMRSLWVINALAATVTPETAARIAADPSVAGVRIDRMHHKDDLLMALGDAPEGNLVQVDAPPVWGLGHFGQGVTVALMDTGADVNHPDLTATWRGGTNSWLDPYGKYAAPFDSDIDGHGTGVLGIMVGGDAGGTTIGMAPKARWIAARMFNDQDLVPDSVIHEIFQWFLDPDGDPDTDDAPDVVNGSWGLTDSNGQANTCVAEFQPDITALNDAGIVTVFAAGNYGPDAATSISPANYSGAIAVGAVNGSDAVFDLSSRGPSACDGRIYPDLTAPGVSVRTTDRSFGGLLTYAFGSGTSYAAPHVSGAVALLAGAFPGVTVANIRAALLLSAADLGPANEDNDYGSGRLNTGDVDGAFAYLKGTLGFADCVRPDVNLAASPFPADIGQSITFTATAAGGSGSYTYQWDVDADGVFDYTTTTPVNSITHTYNAAYTGSVGLTVTDNTSGCTTTLVRADQWSCADISATISAAPDPGTAGDPVVFSSSVAGGTAPYTYAWDLDADGAVDCTTGSCTQTYADAFSGTVTLTVTDDSGCRTTTQTSFTAQAAPASTAGGSGGGGGGGCFLATLLGRSLGLQ